jgi:hypothetical protein
MDVALVWKIEMGLECGQWLLKKLKITVTGAKLLHAHSVSHFSRQPLTPFESPFNFLDRLNLQKLTKRQKTFRRANQQRRFPKWLTSSHTSAGVQYFLVF